jgi:phosphate:Na+ symporter
MSSSLEKANAGRIKKYIAAFTGKVSTAFITGIAVTAAVQSSTAITVITVGLVNAGLMRLPQAIGIIYGSNIGTTITAQLMAFNLTDSCYILLVIGAVFKFTARKNSSKCIASAVIGVGLMFTGLSILNSGVPYIRESETTYRLFKTYGGNPFIGLFLGMIATMLVHSSSATVGITIVLFNSGLINFDAALGITFGDNIGTCITAQLASLGTSVWARRTAWAHTLYNVIGVIVAIILFIPFSNLVQYITFYSGQDKTRLVANAHTIFNVLSALLFLPVTKHYVKFIEWIVKDKG